MAMQVYPISQLHVDTRKSNLHCADCRFDASSLKEEVGTKQPVDGFLFSVGREECIAKSLSSWVQVY